MDVDLQFNEQISGPSEADENPFADGKADIGCICTTTFRWLKKDSELLPVPVTTDNRAKGKPVYFSDVIVKAGSRFLSFDSLRGQKWGYNDRNSRSGWFSMLDRIVPHSPLDYFSEIVQSGSHLESLRLVMAGKIDAAAIDSNALLFQINQGRIDRSAFKILETWGPFPIQPIVIRTDMPSSLKESVRKSLLHAHESFGPELNSFGFHLFTEAKREDYEV